MMRQLAKLLKNSIIFPMNKLLFSATASVLLVVVAGIFSFWGKRAIVSKTEIVQVPHIEVLANGVFEVDATGKTVRELISGDELAVGAHVKTDKTGSAEIYFADDSTARLDAESELVIDEGRYTEKEGISARFTLVVGRVWSKVIALTTPQSVWEVRTANTVATVRGTAFSIGFKDGKSSVIGSENTVQVRPIDKKTGKVLEDQGVLITADTYAELDDVVVAAAATASVSAPKVGEAPRKALQLRKKTAELVKDKWLDKNKDEDATLKARAELRRKKQEERKKEIKEQREEAVKQAVEVQKTSVETNTQPTVPAPTAEVQRTTTTGGTSSVSEEVSSLEIGAERDYGELSEGDAVQFRATLKFKSGNKKDVTGTVLWRVLGGMGSIDKSGVFIAKLADEVAEAGEFSGAVIGVFQDPANGQEFLGKTNIFKVKAKIIENILDIGGQ